jgi:hypothetical protein
LEQFPSREEGVTNQLRRVRVAADVARRAKALVRACCSRFRGDLAGGYAARPAGGRKRRGQLQSRRSRRKTRRKDRDRGAYLLIPAIDGPSWAAQ